MLKLLLREIPIPTETSEFGADVGGASVGIVVGELVEGSSVCGEVVAGVGAGVGLGSEQSIPGPTINSKSLVGSVPAVSAQLVRPSVHSPKKQCR